MEKEKTTKEKLELKYEETEDGYTLEVKGLISKDKSLTNQKNILDKQAKILFKILMITYNKQQELDAKINKLPETICPLGKTKPDFMEKEITTKEKLEKAKELKANYDLLIEDMENNIYINKYYFSKTIYDTFFEDLKQQAKELLEVKIKGCGENLNGLPIICGYYYILTGNKKFCPKCQEENNQADKILKEITNHE